MIPVISWCSSVHAVAIPLDTWLSVVQCWSPMYDEGWTLLLFSSNTNSILHPLPWPPPGLSFQQFTEAHFYPNSDYTSFLSLTCLSLLDSTLCRQEILLGHLSSPKHSMKFLNAWWIKTPETSLNSKLEEAIHLVMPTLR